MTFCLLRSVVSCIRTVTVKDPLLGAHMSIAGSVDKAIERGASMKCTCIQIFTASNNRWEVKKPKFENIRRFKQLKDEVDIRIIVAHNSYLHNLASPNDELLRKSAAGMLDEVLRCADLEIPYLVIHPGSATDGNISKGITRIAKALKQILRDTKESGVSICLETTAGQGNTIGSRFEHLLEIMERVNWQERMGICFDTCHLFASGFDFSSKTKYKNMFKRFDQIIGKEYLKVIHMNDSKHPLGSKKDRHEHIGRGCIGKKPFGFFMNDESIARIPKILETPKGKGTKEDEENLNVLRSLIKV